MDLFFRWAIQYECLAAEHAVHSRFVFDLIRRDFVALTVRFLNVCRPSTACN